MSRRFRGRPRRPERPKEEWIPKTRLGQMVKEGHITSIDEIFQSVYRIKEIEIIELLLPNLEEEVISINLVQRQTDAGELSRFKAAVVVGNRSGYVGLGEVKMKEIGPAIRAAVLRAKLNIFPVKIGCGSWECEGGHAHSVPFKVTGSSGSVTVTLIPAPKGVGLVAADTAKTVLSLAGIQDVWSKTSGHTKTCHNLAKATLNALKQTYKIMTPQDWTK